jgi:hypothetical protein
MTEPEWLAATDPGAMLAFLRDTASPRKLRLFAVSQARRLRRHFDEKYNFERDARKLLALGERAAEGLAKPSRLEYLAEEEGDARAHSLFSELTEVVSVKVDIDAWAFSDLAYACVIEDPAEAASLAVAIMVKRPVRHKVKEQLLAQRARWERPGQECEFRGAGGQEYWHVAVEVEEAVAPTLEPAARADQCRWLREVFGNPFRPAADDPAWRTADVTGLARTMYAERRFDGMPVLADALEEAGCADRPILRHCRSRHRHARGCWVLDLVLDRG